MSNDLRSLFAGTDSYANRVDSSGLSTSPVGTILGWVRFTSLPGGKTLWGAAQHQSPFETRHRLRDNGATQFEWVFREEDGTSRTLFGTHGLSTGTWYLLVAKFVSSDNTYKLYQGIKGAAFPSGYTVIKSQARNGTTSHFRELRTGGVGTTITLGAPVGGSATLAIDGHVCAWASYSNEISDSDIDAFNANWPAESAPATGLNMWKLNEASGTGSATDFWGSATLTYTDGSLGAVGASQCPYTATAKAPPPVLRPLRFFARAS